jgi:hypothetical protein
MELRRFSSPSIHNIGRKPDAAPRLQVLKQSSEVDATAPEAPIVRQAASASPVQSKPEVMAHVRTRGDMSDNIGATGSEPKEAAGGSVDLVSRQDSGIGLKDIEYQGVLDQDSLSPWLEGGKSLARLESLLDRSCGRGVRLWRPPWPPAVFLSAHSSTNP